MAKAKKGRKRKKKDSKKRPLYFTLKQQEDGSLVSMRRPRPCMAMNQSTEPVFRRRVRPNLDSSQMANENTNA